MSAESWKEIRAKFERILSDEENYTAAFRLAIYKTLMRLDKCERGLRTIASMQPTQEAKSVWAQSVLDEIEFDEQRTP